MGPTRLRLVDGAIVDLQEPTYIYATDLPTVGWIASNGREEVGWLFDYDTGVSLPGPVGWDGEKWNLTGTDEGVFAPLGGRAERFLVRDATVTPAP